MLVNFLHALNKFYAIKFRIAGSTIPHFASSEESNKENKLLTQNLK